VEKDDTFPKFSKVIGNWSFYHSPIKDLICQISIMKFFLETEAVVETKDQKKKTILDQKINVSLREIFSPIGSYVFINFKFGR
jgi:hypothetical protein